MTLSREDVENIAHLARLRFDADEIPALTDTLSRIIDFVRQLEAADTDNVTPMAHPLDQAQRLRADAVTEENERDLFQANAGAVEAGLYLVPKVIE